VEFTVYSLALAPFFFFFFSSIVRTVGRDRVGA
jgi:hypothetical protein